MNIKRALKFLALCSSTACAMLLSEFMLAELSKHSMVLNFYTKSPRQHVYTDTMLTVKDITSSVPCPTFPGQVYNSFRYNSRGFQTPDHAYDKPMQTKRVLLIGDSFALGVVPYSQHFFRLLESRINTELSGQTGNTYEFINLGLGCIGPSIERRILEIEGMRYAPDVILYTFYAGNDFTDDIPTELKYMNQIRTPFGSAQLPDWVLQSRITAVLENLFLVYTAGKNLPTQTFPHVEGPLGVPVDDGSIYDPERPSLDEQTYLTKVSNDLGIYSNGGYAFFPSVKQNILFMAEIAHRQQTPFITIIIPAEIQVNTRLRQQVEAYTGTEPDMLDYDLPQEILTNFLKSHALQYIDLLPVFQAALSPEVFFQPRDAHLNTRGEALVAEHLFPVVRTTLSNH